MSGFRLIMVYVNNKKFACESCIKGHRSSACHHTERPLFEIKKKGRPVSQCTKCRELRQAKKVHNKCTCSETDEATKRAETSRLLAGTRQKRYIPIVPALPNGLQDILRSSGVSNTLPADARQRVDTLLNPCNCKSIWKCKCRTVGNAAISENRRGLDVLVCAAEMQASASSWPPKDIYAQAGSLKRSYTSPSGSVNVSRKRPKITQVPSTQGPDLPPIIPPYSAISSEPQDFESMPPMSTITSQLSGSVSTRYNLPWSYADSLEYRRRDPTLSECRDACRTCSEHRLGAPGVCDSRSIGNVLGRFFACAAALPAPPPNRRTELDPMDVTVYPDVARDVGGDMGLRFGLVNLPKLQCCGGRCQCAGACNCGKDCNGSCLGENRNLVHANMIMRVEAFASSETCVA